MDIEQLGKQVVDAAMLVHRELGPGLLESSYEQCLAFELGRCGIAVERQKALPLVYQGMKIDGGYRVDLLVAERVIIELKAVERIEPIHRAQVLAYLRLSKLQLAYLVNFNVRLLSEGLHRVVLGLPEPAWRSRRP
ncbi:MAG: GxxExxY protein [Verrucomicrobia bacterium]|nr:GxxExxY protein [Verrucomicrobiota bacterium]